MYSRLLLGPPSGSKGSSYTRIGASPCFIDDSKKSIPSSAGVLGVFAIVGDEPADEEGGVCLLLGIVKVGWGSGVTNFDLIFTVVILDGGNGGDERVEDGREGGRGSSSGGDRSYRMLWHPNGRIDDLDVITAHLSGYPGALG